MPILFRPSSSALLIGTAMLLAACSPPAPPAPNAPAAQMPPAATPDASVDPTASGPATEAKLAIATVDPACLETIAWVSEREANDIQLVGCRDAALLPAADDGGWRSFEGADGSSIQTRGETTDPTTGDFSVEVIYRSGGSFAGKYQITGKPDAQGILKVGQYKITPLS